MAHAGAHGPLKGELLTSWLARVAVHGGCDPLVLTASIWPRWRIWTCDADRSINPQRIESVAQWFGVPPQAVEATTLISYGKALHGQPQSNWPLWPWIVSMGCRNRLRQGGVPFCPLCLKADEQPYYRLKWRLAWHVGCRDHAVRLLDRCEQCHCVVQPHRCLAVLGDLAHCAVCGFDLRMGTPVKAAPEAMALQQKADGVFRTGEGNWGGETIVLAEWFARLRALVSNDAIRLSQRSADILDHRHIGLWFELQSPAEREARMAGISGLVEQAQAPWVSNTRCSRPATGAASATTTGKRRLKDGRPVAKVRVQEEWARWLRRSRLW